MKELRMGELEARFADIIWENEPISSGELSKLAFEALNWKKTTAFTTISVRHSKNCLIMQCPECCR